MNRRQDANAGRGAQTRVNILNAARQRFAADGYARATIRAIAADAQTDPALVIRYFGNKEGLFAAAAKFDLRMPDLGGLSQDVACRALVDHFLVRWEEDDTLMALLRVAATNEKAIAQLHTIFEAQVLPVVARLRKRSASVVATRAGLVASQMLGLAFCRYVLKLPPLVSLDRKSIVDWLTPTLKRYIFGDS